METDLTGDSQQPRHPLRSLDRVVSSWLDAEPSPYDAVMVFSLLLLVSFVVFPGDWVRNLEAFGTLLIVWSGSALASRRVRALLPVKLRWLTHMNSLQLLAAACVCEIPWLLWLGASRLFPALDTSCSAKCSIGTSLVLFMAGSGGLIAILGAAWLPFELIWRGIHYKLAARE